jgi:NAD+ kinase
MAKTKLPKIVIFGDPKKGRVAQVMKDFTEFAESKAQIVDCCYLEESKISAVKKSDFAIVLGGDGSIISAGRMLCRSNVPVIGVNLGKLGFLAEFSVPEFKHFFDQIITNKLTVEKRMLLSCTILKKGKKQFYSEAINDVYIMAGVPFKTIEMKIKVDGLPLAGCLSDGVIISSPTGSTAYNLSAGGPILGCRMEAMVVTAICPHSLSFRPIVINSDNIIEVVCVKINPGTTVMIDGQVPYKLSADEIVRIEKHPGRFLVVNNPMRTQWDTLATKLNCAEKPNYRK